MPKALFEYFPDPLSVIYFVNSGSEATELALRMSEAYTGSREIIALEHGYHGNTRRSIDISSYKFDGPGGKGKPLNTHLIPIQDNYRSVSKIGSIEDDFTKPVKQIIIDCEAKGIAIGAFIAESILSCAGQIVLP